MIDVPTILTPPPEKGGIRYEWHIPFRRNGTSMGFSIVGHYTYAHRKDARRAALRAWKRLFPQGDML
jgi:hypothetical protein